MSDNTKQGKYWFLTIFGNYVPPTELPEDYKYIMGQQEMCPTTNRLHWHVLLGFKTNKRFSAVKTLYPTANIQYSISEKAREYVEKEDTAIPGTRFALGAFPVRRNNALDWQKVKDAAKAGNLDSDDIPAQIYVENYNTLTRIKDDNQVKPAALSGCCGVWIWGPPGVGKTYLAETKYGCNYSKKINKWWNNYEHGMIPLLDDLSPRHVQLNKTLADSMKLWADKNPFQAEIKNRVIWARPPLLVVTSNFSLEAVFGMEPDFEAIKDRFKIVHVPMKLHNLEKRPHVLDDIPLDIPRSPALKKPSVPTVDLVSPVKSVASSPPLFSENFWDQFAPTQTQVKPSEVVIDIPDSDHWTDDFDFCNNQ